MSKRKIDNSRTVMRYLLYFFSAAAFAFIVSCNGDVNLNEPPTAHVAEPVFDPVEGTYTLDQTVTITTATTGADIRYTDDGSIPTPDYGQPYIGPIAVTTSRMLKAIAYKKGMLSSNVVTADYTINLTTANPILTPGGGYYTAAQTVSISCATSDAEIRYTTDGTDPLTNGTAIVPGESFDIAGHTVVKAIALKTGWLNSSQVQVEYTITGTAAAPFFSVTSRYHTNQINVILNSPMDESKICYTTNGSVPSRTNGISVDAGSTITIPDSMTVRMISYIPAWESSSDSGVVSKTYTITGVVASPVYANVDTYHTSQFDTILSCTTPGAKIRYTTGGSTPSRTIGTQIDPGATITVSSDMTIRAIAYVPAWETSSNSTVVEQPYTLTGPVDAPSFSDTTVLHTNQFNVTLNCATAGSRIRYTMDGTAPSRSAGTEVDAGTQVTVSSGMTMRIMAYVPAWEASSDTGVLDQSYTITGFVSAPSVTNTDTYHTGQFNTILMCLTPGAKIRYTTDGDTPSRSVGTEVDPFASITVSSNMTIRAIAYVPAWNTSSDSTVTAQPYTLTGPVDAPSFSDTTVLHTNQFNVTLNCATAGSRVRYTTDGSAPSRSVGTEVDAGTQVAVSSSMTMRIMAYVPAWEATSDTGVLDQTYTVTGSVADPGFTPANTYFVGSTDVALSCVTPDAIIRYSLTAIPTRSTGTLYTGTPLHLTTMTTIYVRAFVSAWNADSDTTVTRTYTPTTQPAMIYAQPRGGSIAESQKIFLKFSKSMDPATLALSGSLAAAAGTVTWNTPANTIVSILPATAWPQGRGKTMTVAANDSCGIPIAQRTLTFFVLTPGGGFDYEATGAIPSGKLPRRMAVADFNGDGHEDLASSNAQGNSVSVFLGNGNGTFQAKTEYPTGNNPIPVVTADFNDDGKVDLASGNCSSDSFSVFLGNGNGTFQAKTDFATGRGPIDGVADDVNTDGIIDLIFLDLYNNVVNVHLGNGDGSFLGKTSYAAGTTPQSLVVDDFNGDGKHDLAISNNGSGTLSILKGNGDGTFMAKNDFPLGGKPYSLVKADFNNDGILDLASPNYFDNTVSLLLGNGDGTFGARSTYATKSYPMQMIARDLNGDGNIDLAIGSYGNSILHVYLGNGDGTLQERTDYTLGNDPEGLVAGDFNEDGVVDIAAALWNSHNIGILIGEGNGTFPTRKAVTASTYPMGVAIFDFDGDNANDLAVANYGSASVSILRGYGDGTFMAKTDYAAGTSPRYVATGFFNADGYADLAVVNEGSSSVSILRGNGDGTFMAKTDYATGSKPYCIAIDDFNADGKSDLAVSNSNSATLSVLLGNGNGTFQGKVDYATGSYPYSVVSGDFNADGAIDIATGNYSGKNMSVFIGNGNGTFQEKTDYALNMNVRSLTPGDFNDDGILDLAVVSILVTSVYESYVSIFIGNGNGTFGGKMDMKTGYVPSSISSGDFNADGHPDLAVGLSTGFGVTLHGGAGDGTFPTRIDYITDDDSQSPGIEDLNQDGRLDIVIPQGSGPVSGLVTILLHN